MTSTVTATFSQNNSGGSIQLDVHNSGSGTSTNSRFSRDFRILTFLRNHAALLSICALILTILLLLVTIILLTKRNQVPVTVNIISECGDSSEGRNVKVKETSKSTTPDINSNVLIPKFEIVSRNEWSAKPPKQPPTPLHTPVPYVLILHTGTENCYTTTQCVLDVRFIQIFQMENHNWDDIGYNFLSGGDGKVFEGRGWKAEAEGSISYGYSDKSIEIAFVGTFNASIPGERQINACKKLIKKGIELGYIKEDYKLLAATHLQKVPVLQNEQETLFDNVKKWEHWTSQE